MLLDELLFDKTPVIKIEKSPFEVTVGPEPALKEIFRNASNDRPMKEFILNANGGQIIGKVFFFSSQMKCLTCYDTFGLERHSVAKRVRILRKFLKKK